MRNIEKDTKRGPHFYLEWDINTEMMATVAKVLHYVSKPLRKQPIFAVLEYLKGKQNQVLEFLLPIAPCLFDNRITPTNIINNLKHYKDIAITAVKFTPEVYNSLFLLQCDPTVRDATIQGMISQKTLSSPPTIEAIVAKAQELGVYNRDLIRELWILEKEFSAGLNFDMQLHQYNSRLIKKLIADKTTLNNCVKYQKAAAKHSEFEKKNKRIRISKYKRC